MAKKYIRIFDNLIIEIDADADPVKSKKDYLRKYFAREKLLSPEQQRREIDNIRGGKTLQRTRFKR